MTLEGVRQEVLDKVGAGAGTRMSGHIPFTPRAKKVLELSLREALQLHHNYIGTEHILLGLIREDKGVAAQIMREHGDLLAIRAAVLDRVPAGDEEDKDGLASTTGALLRRVRLRLGGSREDEDAEVANVHATPATDATLAEAARLAGDAPVGSHHLLLAALADPDSAAARTLAGLGVDLDQAQGTAAHRGRHRHQRRTARGGRPPPDVHPGDRGNAHDRGGGPGARGGRGSGAQGRERAGPRRSGKARQPRKARARPPRRP